MIVRTENLELLLGAKTALKQALLKYVSNRVADRSRNGLDLKFALLHRSDGGGDYIRWD